MNIQDDDPTADMQTRLVSDDSLGDASPILPPAGSTEEQCDEEQQNLTIHVADEVERGEKQPNQFRDAPFAILFFVHLATILYFAFAWGLPVAMEGTSHSSSNYTNGDDDFDAFEGSDISGVLCLLALCSVAGLLILAATMVFMIQFAEQLIHGSLIFSVLLSFVFAVAFAMKHMIGMSVIYFIVGAIGACYYYVVRPRIPFATANLKTATTAIKANMGITVVAFGMVAVFCVWSVLSMLSYLGIYMHATRGCQDEKCQENPVTGFVGFLFLLSFYWTSEVITNILHVTTAGLVGTWWMAPLEASSFCSTAITDSFSRACSYSLGSICFGSLLMAIIRTLRSLIHHARQSNQRNALLLCILECLVACLEGIAEYFNKWAFIYVGLYGYDYLTSGRRVVQLFRDRGWTTIINDNLIYRVLTLLCLVVGGLTGCVGMLLAYLVPSWVDAFGDYQYGIAFFICFLIGAAMANVVFGVVASSVDTVYVCYAESPNDFQSNHPELSQEMLLAWRQIYPNEFGM